MNGSILTGRKRIGKGRPISELPIPDAIRAQGDKAIRLYQDSFRLAYQAESPVNWCAALGTVLADEEVINGRSERGDHPVQRIPLRQWMLRITSYADRLVEDLETLQWPDPIKEMQKNWVGRSEGAEVDFFIGQEAAFKDWMAARSKSGFPESAGLRCDPDLYHAARHAVRRHLYGAGTGASSGGSD